MSYIYVYVRCISRFDLFLIYYCVAALHVTVFPLNGIFFNEYTSDGLWSILCKQELKYLPPTCAFRGRGRNKAVQFEKSKYARTRSTCTVFKSIRYELFELITRSVSVRVNAFMERYQRCGRGRYRGTVFRLSHLVKNNYIKIRAHRAHLDR